MSKFNINIHCVVLSINTSDNQSYVLSTNEKDIIFPKLSICQENMNSVDDSLNKFLKEKLPEVNELELTGQIIKFHCDLIKNRSKNTINMIFGFIIDYNQKMNNTYWIPFNYTNIVKYSPIIFETIQKLR